jgi:hypothetical protein
LGPQWVQGPSRTRTVERQIGPAEILLGAADLASIGHREPGGVGGGLII